jgi:hypothetical protein
MSTVLSRLMGWFRRATTSVEEVAAGEMPAATPAPGSVREGDEERETSTNAQLGGAAGQPWPEND